MSRIFKVAVAMAPMVFLAGCGSAEYIISTADGTMIPVQGKPKLDEDTGMYSYKDAEGRQTTIKKEDVKQIMER